MKSVMGLGPGDDFMLRFVRPHSIPSDGKVGPAPKAGSGVSAVSNVVFRGGYVRPASPHAQGVIAIVKYRMSYSSKASFEASLHTKVNYTARNDRDDEESIQGRDEKGNQLTPDEAWEKLRSWRQDDRYYDLVFSAKNGVLMDLDAFAAKTMEKLRQDVLTEDELKRGAVIEYVSYKHYDTGHPHNHILMRAKVEDRELRLSGGYISHGLRARAQGVATDMLGYRMERELSVEEAKRLQAERLAEKRRELGLDPGTGTMPRQADDDDKTGAAKEVKVTREKSTETSRDDHGFDGGFDW